jgi:hypothetical protein
MAIERGGAYVIILGKKRRLRPKKLVIKKIQSPFDVGGVSKGDQKISVAIR